MRNQACTRILVKNQQIKEIINASKCSIFFIDEDQRVTLKDIGTREEIRKWAKSEGAEINELKLDSQFRCNGSDGYRHFSIIFCRSGKLLIIQWQILIMISGY